MVDPQSKYRMYSYGYTAVVPQHGTYTLRELYHESGRKVFPTRSDRPTHDCRAEVAKKYTAPEEWEAWLLSQGLCSTYDAVVNLHSDRRYEPLDSKKKPNNLLYHVGMRGSANGDFDYPRGLCTTSERDIVVADSHNHRVQIFSRSGVFKLAFGKHGCEEGEFNEPTDVAELPNGDLAVADRRNKRVQVFSEEGIFVSELSMKHQPFSLACNHRNNLVVCTRGRTVEFYSKLQFVRTFPVPCTARRLKELNSPVHICISNYDEVIVGDLADQRVKVFNLEGKLLSYFRPRSHTEGLAYFLGGICVTNLGNILVADMLNHSVSLFTLGGTLLRQVVVPLDGLGSVQSLAVGPEDHLIITEASITGEHCLKIFRCGMCLCHGEKLPCSKKKTVISSVT